MPKKQINQYCQYFQEQLEAISSIDRHMHQKILIVSILDTWARVRVPKLDGNRKRFTCLIRERTGWSDHNRVSMPLLNLSLESFSKSKAERLKREVQSKLINFKYGHITNMNEVDPVISDIIDFAETDDERKLVEDTEHVNLLYTYRNHLVHEFNEPGHGFSITNNFSPYYHGMGTLDGNNSIELVYPQAFFMKIAKDTLANLEIYLKANSLDPYAFYEFGTFWRKG